MNAYKETYLNNAADAFGNMMNYAVNDCELDGDVFLHMFVTSGIAEKFGRGNPKIIAGMSGFDLANKVIQRVMGEVPIVKPADITDYRTPEYWAGWALAKYQWHSARSFSSILRALPFSEILNRYNPLHEADISKFYLVADNSIAEANTQINLRRLREAMGLSQAQLAKEAQAITIAKLSRVLGCEMEDLLT
jgi:hypothetical protein